MDHNRLNFFRTKQVINATFFSFYLDKKCTQKKFFVLKRNKFTFNKKMFLNSRTPLNIQLIVPKISL